jgi:DnaD/phage-associated family protein
MANPQPTDAHLIMAHSINEAIMQRDFTKRQRKVLDLILRLSWGCNKKSALIPYQKDFEIVGVNENHIKAELSWLVSSKVIITESSRYYFNKNFDDWQVSRVKPFRPERLRELISANLKDASQFGNSTTAETSQFGNSEEDKLPKTGSADFPKEELSGSQKRNSATSELASAKERFKESIKENNTTAAAAGDYQGDGRIAELTTLYEENFGMIMPLIAEELKDICQDYPLEWFKPAFKEACVANARNLKYVVRILERWKRDGFMAPFPKGELSGINRGDPEKTTVSRLRASLGKPLG